ncbi:MAG TPA: hypothetical protein VEC93_07860 [Anaerolineae bacterium]|nr:hypothetical protein [Anaerolineae bacterium]
MGYTNEAGILPRAQLFAMTSTLFGLGRYTNLGQPNGNAEV